MTTPPRAALDATFDFEGTEYTLRQWFQKILITLWDEGEGFSGKRPLGNSDWQFQLALGLVEAGVVDENPHDPDDYPEGFDEYITRCIEAL